MKPKKDENGQVDRYTTIRYAVRAKLGITLSLYALCDIVDHLSKSRRSNGWAIASNAYYANLIGMSERGVIKLKNRAIDQQLIERPAAVTGSDTRIRTTLRWEVAHEEGRVIPIEPKPKTKTELAEEAMNPEGGEQSSGVNKVQGGGEQSSGGGEQSSPYNKNYKNSYKKATTKGENAENFQDRIRLLINTTNRKDTLRNRAQIWAWVCREIETDEFKEQWRFIGDPVGLGHKHAAGVLREWITKGDWFQVSNFQINKIGNWALSYKRNLAKRPAASTTNQGYSYEGNDEF